MEFCSNFLAVTSLSCEVESENNGHLEILYMVKNVGSLLD